MVAGQDQIRPQQLIGFHDQGLAHPVTEKAHGGHGRYGEHQGQDQQTQFPGAGITIEEKKREFVQDSSIARNFSTASSILETPITVMPAMAWRGQLAAGTRAWVKPSLAASLRRS